MLRILAMAKQEHMPDQCDHFTGCYAGRCRAGVSYDDVRDQDRREQAARFPCVRSQDSFTTCDRAQFTPRPRVRRRIDLSEKNRGREVVFEQETAAGTVKVRGVLVGWTGDRERVLISVAAKRRKRRSVITAPASRCYLARKPGAAGEQAAAGSSELPLFDLREVQPRQAGGRREKVTDKAA